MFISRVDLIALTTTLVGLCCAVLTSEHLSCTSQRIGWLNGFQIYINSLYTPTDITATLWMVATHTHTRYCNVSPQFRTFRLTHSLFSKQAILTNYIAHPTGFSLSPPFLSTENTKLFGMELVGLADTLWEVGGDVIITSNPFLTTISFLNAVRDVWRHSFSSPFWRKWCWHIWLDES